MQDRALNPVGEFPDRLSYWETEKYMDEAWDRKYGSAYTGFINAEYRRIYDNSLKAVLGPLYNYKISDFLHSNFFRILVEYPAVYYFLPAFARGPGAAIYFTSAFGVSTTASAFLSKGNDLTFSLMHSAISGSLILGFFASKLSWKTLRPAQIFTPKNLVSIYLSTFLFGMGNALYNRNNTAGFALGVGAAGLLGLGMGQIGAVARGGAISALGVGLGRAWPFLLASLLLPLKIEQLEDHSDKLKRMKEIVEYNLI